MTSPNLGSILKRFRIERRLSYRKLGALSGIQGTNISAIEKSERTCGPRVAQALANALAIGGAERERIIALATKTVTRGNSPCTVRALHDDLLGAIVGKLAAKGLDPNRVQSYDVQHGCSHHRHDLVVTTKDNSRYGIDITIKRLRK